MGGHSHWAGIKHKKAITDAKKGKVYTKIIREITIAAKMSGGDPDGNPRLRKAMDDAKGCNMPLDNVKRAIMKGTGQIPGVVYEEITYEGFGPCKVAMLVEVTTDSKNRTFSEIRKIFEHGGGSIGSAGCVAFMFNQKGLITVKKSAVKEEDLMDTALEAGAEDISSPDGSEVFEVLAAPSDFEKVKAALAAKNIPVETAEVTMIPTTEVDVDEANAPKVLKLIEDLEEHDDVKNVYANFNIPESILAKLGQ